MPLRLINTNLSLNVKKAYFIFLCSQFNLFNFFYFHIFQSSFPLSALCFCWEHESEIEHEGLTVLDSLIR